MDPALWDTRKQGSVSPRRGLGGKREPITCMHLYVDTICLYDWIYVLTHSCMPICVWRNIWLSHKYVKTKSLDDLHQNDSYVWRFANNQSNNRKFIVRWITKRKHTKVRKTDRFHCDRNQQTWKHCSVMTLYDRMPYVLHNIGRYKICWIICKT